MVTSELKAIIQTALRHEEQTHVLRRSLTLRLTELQTRLVLPGIEPVTALLSFVTRYINSVPGSLRLVTVVSHRMGFFAYAAPFLHLAEDYFLQEPDDVVSEVDLGALLGAAFLAHRLMEEVNDHHIRHLQRPLLPVDMTEANLIVHHVLGDDYASQLEGLVAFTASGLLQKEYVWEEARQYTGFSLSEGTEFSAADLAEVKNDAVRLRLAS